jgi:release factor glutamine methyltransferase
MPQWTLLQALNWTTEYFSQKKLPTPRLDAEVLLASTLGLGRLDLYLQFERPLTDSERDSFRSLIRKRALGEPVAYLTGSKEFWSLAIDVGPGVLIPRPDSETLVQAVITWSKENSDVSLHGLDLGVGSGALSLALLREIPNLVMTGMDRSLEAIGYAQSNRDRLVETKRFDIRHGDWSQDPRWEHPFDFIISNPPYISHEEWASLEDTVKNYEPYEALVPGRTGLEAYQDLVPRVIRWLKPGGSVFLEIGETQASEVSAILSYAGFSAIRVLKDLASHDRVVQATFQTL